MCLQYVQSNIKYHRFLDVDSHKITRNLQGLVCIHMLQSQHHIIEAFVYIFRNLKPAYSITFRPCFIIPICFFPCFRLTEKFQIHSQPQKANAFKTLTDTFLDSPIGKENVTKVSSYACLIDNGICAPASDALY